MSGTCFAKRHGHHLGFIPFAKTLSLGLYCGKLNEVKKRTPEGGGSQKRERKNGSYRQNQPRGGSQPFLLSFLGSVEERGCRLQEAPAKTEGSKP